MSSEQREEQMSEKEKIMLTGGQNRKTTADPDILQTQHDGVTTPSGNSPHNTDATTGANPGSNEPVRGTDTR